MPSVPGFRSLRRVAHGGFGVIFEAEPRAGGRAAIKVARADEPQAPARLLREVSALRRIGPPCVPEVLDVGELEGGAPYFVMEYIGAPTLADRLVEAAGPMPLEEVAAIAASLLRALQRVHERGYVHGDLKPENIFIDDDARATLIDFGLSTSAGADGADEPTKPGVAVGTAEYMAPEQCEGRADIDERADIYAVGVILFEMLAARPPFWGPHAVIQQSHRSRRPPRLSMIAHVPPSVDDVVRRCLAKDRRDRFASASDALQALIAALVDRSSDEPLTLMGVPSSRRASMEIVAPPPVGHERRRVALVWFETEAQTSLVRQRLLLLGGQLAHARGARYVAIYSHQVGDNPARRALRAAHDLVKHGICERAVVDSTTVLIQTRPDGSRRFMSPLFFRPELFPDAACPLGVFLSKSAAEALPDVEGARISSRGWVLLGFERPATSASSPAAVAEPIVGRGSLVDELLESARRAFQARKPCVAGVIGEEGQGKSRLAAEMSARIRALYPTAVVIDLSAREHVSEGGLPIARELLRRALDLPEERPGDGGRAVLRARLGPSAGADTQAAVATTLGWIGPDAPALRVLTAAPGALGAALVVVAGEALRRRAARAPLVVVLDDAHFADDVTLGALEYAALADVSAPIWVCALGLPSFEEARPTWGDRAGNRVRSRLAPLSAVASAELCRLLLRPAEDVPDAAIRRMVDWTQGVPRMIVELVRALKREGIVRRPPRGGAHFLAADELERVADLPLLDWMAHAEIDALTPALRAHARLLSLLGPDVSVADVEGTIGRLEQQGGADDMALDAGVGMARLLSIGVLVRSGEGRARFRRALVRDALARSIPEALRRRVHAAALEHHRGASGAPDASRLAHIARHAAGAGEAQEAARAYLALAALSRAAHRYLDAELLYGRALDRPGGAREALEAHRGRGLMRYRLGRYDDALTDFARARSLADDLGDREQMIEILLDEATALDWMGEFARSAERSERAKELAEGAPSAALEARLLLSMGRSAHRADKPVEAAGLLRRAASAAAALGDDAYETRVISLILLGFILQHGGESDLGEAARALDETITLCEAHLDRIHLGPALAHRALLRGLRGDNEGMSADYARLIALARELGQRALEVVAHYNLGEHLYLTGDAEAAEAHVRRALEADARGPGGRPRPVVMLLDARVRLYKGDVEGAREVARSIRERERAEPGEGREREPLAPSEEILCSMVELAASGADSAAWDDLVARSAELSVGQEHIEVLEARALAAARTGAAPEARLLLERAIEAAERIPNVMGARLRRGA